MKRDEARARANERCWSTIGVLGGNGSCPLLVELTHCRECEVITIAADQLLARTPSSGNEEAARPPGVDRRAPGGRKPAQTFKTFSVITFEVGGQALALEAARVVEASAARTVRRVPHTTSAVFRGLVNVQGKLEPCFSLGALLGLADVAGAGEPRLLVIGDDARRCAFFVHKPSLEEANLDAIGAPPSTVSAALESHVRGIIRIHDRPWSLLDADRLLTNLERRLS
jgi:chemotaxis-related protein WspD